MHITSIHPVEYKGFIRFQIRSSKDDASEYATYCPKSHGYQKQAERVEKDIWLGKVLDRENGIFCNKERGIFKFTTEDGFSSLPDTEVAMFRNVLNSKKSKNQSRPRNLDNSNVSIDFGDIFILHEYFSDCGLFNIFHNAYPENTDTLDSLIVYRLLKSSSNRFAFNWWNESYVKYLYPKAQLSSQQISNFLSDLGNETNYRRYIIEHINYVKGLTPNYYILIDSTGLPNDIKIPITAVNNHNGLISNEIRLIFVVESNTGLPLYYRYVPGNIIDVSTLNMVINELKVYKVKVNRAVIDAGYYSKDNLLALHKNNIPFIIRIPEKLNLYKNLIEKHWKDLDSKSNYVIYNNRHLFIKKIGIKLFGSKVDSFAYVCLDTDKARKDQKNFLSKKLLFVDDNEYQCKKQSFGIFVLLSTENIKISNLLPYYYARQGVEQIFDYLKNEIDILPIRVHSEKTFNGHLLLSFMSLMGYISFNNALKKMNLSASIALDSLGRFHSRVYHKRIIPDVANKSVNDICKALNIKIPNYIKI